MKDYSFSGIRSNPYVERSVNRRFLVLISLIIFCVLGTIGLLLIHPIFSLRFITVNGAVRTHQKEIGDTVMGILDHRRFFVLPGNNFFIANLDDAEQVILSRFPVAGVTVHKKFPGSLVIDLEEKKAVVVYDNGHWYQAFDSEGGLVARILRIDPPLGLILPSTSSTTSTSSLARSTQALHIPQQDTLPKEWQNIPMVVHEEYTEAATSSLNSDVISGALAWYSFIEQTLQIKVAYIRLLNGPGYQAEIKTKEGFFIFVNLTADREGQYAAIVALLRQNPVTSRKSWQYIEARYPGKIYWK